LPVARQPLSVTSVRNPSFFRQNRSTATATREMVSSVATGDSRSQRFRNIDVIEYETERRSQATLSIGRQQPATSAQVRSLSSRQNISMGETVSVGTTTESRRSTDATRHETERKLQTAWVVSRQPMTSSFIPTRSPSSVRPNRSTNETASVGTAGASNGQLQSADDATRYVPPLVGSTADRRTRFYSVLGKKDRSPSSLDDQSCCSAAATSRRTSIRSLKKTRIRSLSTV
jgi:hypothetical protein